MISNQRFLFFLISFRLRFVVAVFFQIEILKLFFLVLFCLPSQYFISNDDDEEIIPKEEMSEKKSKIKIDYTSVQMEISLINLYSFKQIERKIQKDKKS